jgi:hypothetical protein
MVTQGQNYITGKKFTLPKMTEKITEPVLEGALPVMQTSRFGKQHICWYPNAQIANTGTGQRITSTGTSSGTGSPYSKIH